MRGGKDDVLSHFEYHCRRGKRTGDKCLNESARKPLKVGDWHTFSRKGSRPLSLGTLCNDGISPDIFTNLSDATVNFRARSHKFHLNITLKGEVSI